MKRMTRQRNTILDCFKQAQRPLSAQELLEAASKVISHINLATIYRNLKTLVEEKILVVVQLPGQPPRYEYNGLEDHHHFLCQNCNRLFDVEESISMAPPTIPEGFQVLKCDITLHGVCLDCTPSQPGGPS